MNVKSYPIRVTRWAFGERYLRKRSKVQEFNRVAAWVEAYLNLHLAGRPEHAVGTYSSVAVADALGEDRDVVQDVIFATDCGANGITILKGDLDLALRDQSDIDVEREA